MQRYLQVHCKIYLVLKGDIIYIKYYKHGYMLISRPYEIGRAGWRGGGSGGIQSQMLFVNQVSAYNWPWDPLLGNGIAVYSQTSKIRTSKIRAPPSTGQLICPILC